MKRNSLKTLCLKAALFIAANMAVIGQTVAQTTANDGYEVTDEGAWCWFADPRALHYESPDSAINATYMGYIDVHGNIKAMQYDFVNNKREEVLVRSYFQPDDHDNPTFLVLPDERVMLFYSRHTDEACFYYRVSQKKGDITTLGEEKVIKTANNTTYPSPFILSDDPTHIYLCWRGINWHPTIAKLSLPDENDDVSIEWGPYQIVQSTGARPYAKYFSNGKDKLMLAYTTGHPDNEYPNCLYFNRIDINKMQLEDINGNTLSTIADGAFNVSKTSSYANSYPATIVDKPTDKRDWLWQLSQDSEGHPCIAMVQINNGKTSHDYYLAEWNGSEWKKTYLGNGGGHFHQTEGLEMCYSSGMSLNPDNPHEVYVSLPTQGQNGSAYEIYKITVGDNAVKSKERLTSNSSQNNVRPYFIPGSANSPLKLGWMHGEYYDWIVSSSRPQGYCTSIRCDYEWPYATQDMADGLFLHETFDSIADGNAYNEQSTATVKSGILLTDETKTGQTAMPDGDFTVSLSLQLSQQKYYGQILSIGDITYGLDSASMKPYITIGGQTYKSTNTLGTSDVWQTQTRGTNGVWYTPEKLDFFNLAITRDGNAITTYVNGLIDQRLSQNGNAETAVLQIGGFKGWVEDVDIYSRSLNQDEIKQLAKSSIRYTLSDEMKNEEALDNLDIPEDVYTDIVLPATTTTGLAVTWASSDETVLSATGIATLPETATTVTLTATIGDQQRDFTVTVYPRDIEHNVVAIYTFESQDVYESDGAKLLKDVSGNGRDAEIKGAATIDGTLNLTANTAAGFSSNGYLLAPSGILSHLRSYTFFMDATPKSLSNAPRLYDFGSASSNSVFGRANKLTAGVKYNGGTTTMVDATTQLQSGKQAYVAFTYDAATHTTQIYLDGALVGSGTNVVREAYEVAALATDKRNYIGRTQWWESSVASSNIDYCGTIDNFHVYDIALTQDEIKQLHDQTTAIESIMAGGKADGGAWKLSQTVCSPGATISVVGNSNAKGVDIKVYDANGRMLSHSIAPNATATLKAPTAKGAYVAVITAKAGKASGVCKFIVR